MLVNINVINEGNLGLIKAIDKYDVSLGYHFSTYAIWWIKQSINRAIVDTNTVVRLPEGVYRELNKIRKKLEKLEFEKGRSISLNEFIDELNIPKKHAFEYYQYLNDPISLNKSIGVDGDNSIIDFITNGEEVDSNIINKDLLNDIEMSFAALNENEVKVIKMRYGLCEYKGNPNSLAKTAKELSISNERVRQIQYKALLKMRKYIRGNRDLSYLEHYVK